MNLSTRFLLLTSFWVPPSPRLRTRRLPPPATKIAIVDMQRALNETEDGRAAKGKLKKLFEDRQKQLDKQQNDLQDDEGEPREAARRALA